MNGERNIGRTRSAGLLLRGDETFARRRASVQRLSSLQLSAECGVRILRVSTTARLTPPLILRAQPRLVSMAAVLCMLLIGVTAYDTIHVHRSLGPLESA